MDFLWLGVLVLTALIGWPWKWGLNMLSARQNQKCSILFRQP